jgi:hypothetical protein
MVEIRGVTNGYPNSSLLYDYSWTKKAGVDIKPSVNGSVPTKFEFYTPIFLPSNAEYCFVVLCNTTKTSIWCSELGKKAFLPTDYTEPTGELISKQPYLGSMFISQNSTTWTAEQTKDVKFKINRCKFKNSGNAKFVNSSAKDIYRYPFTKVLPPNALKFTEGSKEVTLYVEGHGWNIFGCFVGLGLLFTHSAEKQKASFARFYRISNNRNWLLGNCGKSPNRFSF